MKNISTKLFNSAGYVFAKDYIEDIDRMRKNRLWRLPIGIGDKLQIFILSIFIKISWFSDILYIIYPHTWSPSYNILIKYLIKNKIFDSVSEKNEPYSGYYSFFIIKYIYNPNGIERLTGQGVARDKFTALSKAIGEMVERSISGLYDNTSKVLKDSADSLIKSNHLFFYPPKYHRFLDIQKRKYKELCNDSRDIIEWVDGYNLITKDNVYIPKQITSWFKHNANTERMLISPTSNGCAGYFTKDGATLRGLLEVVQRDAFLCHWLTKTAPKRIQEEDIPDDIKKTIDMFNKRGISIFLLDITALPIPSVCVAAITKQSNEPLVALSAASSVNFDEAIVSALDEMVSCSEIFYYKQSDVKFRANETKYEPFLSSLNKEGRQRYWTGEEKIKKFEWFISGGVVSYKDLIKNNLSSGKFDSNKLKTCLLSLKTLGKDYYPLVYCPNNKVQKKINFYISQVYIPKAIPFYLKECYGTFDSDRLNDFVVSKGNKNWELNPDPHMFS